MVKEAYVSYEVAKLLKEKGFDEPCMFYYTAKKTTGYRVPSENWNRGVYLSRPTLQMACAWLREEHDLHISTCPFENCSNDAEGNVCDRRSFWSFDICSVYDGQYIYQDYEQFRLSEFQTHEEAVEAALKYVLENLI